jgi:tetraacyldisaccharide 4'-kinase
VHHLKFRDHHPYNNLDLQKIIRTFKSLSAANKVIVSTGKDIVKLKEFPDFLDLPSVVLEIDIEFSNDRGEKLIKDILSHVREN